MFLGSIAAMSEEANSTSDESFNRKKKIPKKITESYLSNSGKFYLERFAASTEQFRRVMTRKIRKSCTAHPDQGLDTCLAQLETVIAKFQSMGFLNDAGYSTGLALSLKNRGWPRGRIIMRLKEKGIAPELIEQAVPANAAQDDFLDAIVWIKRKKLGAYATREKPFDKNLASLGRAGFDYHSASKALKLTKDEAEEILANRF